MIPNPIDREKKIWPYAAIHTELSPSLSHFGLNRASRPADAPSRNSERTTSTAKRTTSTGTKTVVIRPMPDETSNTSVRTVMTHTSTSTAAIGQTTSKENVRVASIRRNSLKKKPSGSSPHAFVTARTV